MTNSESQQLTKNSSEERLSASSRSSFSSLSADLSCDSPLSPATILQFQGVPFSWEKLPGIPKSHETQQTRRKRETLLPLPPPPTASLNRFSTTDLNSRNNKKSAAQSEKDPFLAAFIECCRDEYNHHQNSKNMKKMPPTSTNHRFGFFSLYAICKTSGPVAESLVYIPKSSNSLF
ncbi:hypothetical protein QQ045_002762 [Rhodiola kirilowii]